MRRRATTGDLLRIVRPREHRLAQDRPTDQVFRWA